MKFIRQIIRESIQIVENIQLADKVYFKPGKLSPRVREVILQITGGDALTKIFADIYYAEQQQQHKMGAWAVAHVSDDVEEQPDETGHYVSDNDVMKREDWIRIKAMYLQLKAYNKNIFPIAGLNVNGVPDIWELIRALKERASILEHMKRLPSIAIRNMKEDIRTLRTSGELQQYRNDLEHFLAYYSYLDNRDPKFRKNIENKMFRAGVTLEDLLSFAEEKDNLIGGRKFTKNIIKKLVYENDSDLEVVYDSGNVMVVDVTSPDGIKMVGCNSLWCFTYGKEFENAYRQWENYSTNDHVYVIIDFSVSSDSVDFMHVLIKPLDYNTESSDEGEGDVNDSKLFNMANEESYNALGIVNNLVGDKAPFILHFDEPVKAEGPSSKWPYEDPNQLKLDLKEIRLMIRNSFLNEAKKSKFEKLKDNKIPLTDEERKKVMDADAVWHFSPGNKPSPAVWKSKSKNGKITYVCNTHRAYQERPTLKGAISIFHSFIKGTS